MTALAEPVVLGSLRSVVSSVPVACDGSFLGTTDPFSGLVDGGWSSGLPCSWETLALGDSLRPFGFPHELGMLLTAQGVCWGRTALYRRAVPFSRSEETAFRRMAGDLTAELMRRALRVPVGRVPVDQVGVINLGFDGSVDSINDQGRELLDFGGAQRCPDNPLLPIALRPLCAGLLRGSRRGVMLLPDENLGWLQVHGTVQHGVGRRCVTVSLQSARPLQVAPILLAARGATPRAVQVTLRVLRGMTSAEIAAELKISPHTVQDHLKPVFTALSVNSRRQLISSLFPSLKPYDLC